MIAVAELPHWLQSGLSRRFRLQSRWRFNRRRQGAALHLRWSQRERLATVAFALTQQKCAGCQGKSGAANPNQQPAANRA
jgi:hypothetical protein